MRCAISKTLFTQATVFSTSKMPSKMPVLQDPVLQDPHHIPFFQTNHVRIISTCS